MPDRLFPKRERTPEVLRLLINYPARHCKSMHECCLCDDLINLGDVYFDGGIRWRAHSTCVQGAEVSNAK